jgi:hypothetical protein
LGNSEQQVDVVCSTRLKECSRFSLVSDPLPSIRSAIPSNAWATRLSNSNCARRTACGNSKPGSWKRYFNNAGRVTYRMRSCGEVVQTTNQIREHSCTKLERFEIFASCLRRHSALRYRAGGNRGLPSWQADCPLKDTNQTRNSARRTVETFYGAPGVPRAYTNSERRNQSTAAGGQSVQRRRVSGIRQERDPQAALDDGQ